MSCPWEVVKAVAPAVFGRCTSVAAVKGGAPRTISTNTPPPPPPATPSCYLTPAPLTPTRQARVC